MSGQLSAFGSLLLLAVHFGSTPAAAQIVHGRVIEEGTGRAVPGAFVSLVRADGSQRFSVLSAADGRFALRAPAAGSYRIVVERIGYGRKVSPDFTLSAAEPVTYTIVVPVAVVDLGGLVVEARSRCERGPASGPATARLWEEVRKALEVTRWAGEQRALRMDMVNTRRELDAATLRVQAAEEERASGYYDGSPYRSIPLERLRERGYVQQAPDGEYDYYAPDADILLSDGFLAQHCFGIEPAPPAEPGLVGLAFEPLPGHALPDVAGVLWVDRATAELRRVDFRYTKLPLAGADWPQVGGRVEFERLANGMWIVQRWYIRMPAAAVRKRDEMGRHVQDLTRLTEVGGSVRSVRTASGALIAEAAGATIFGTAFDSVSNQPLAGATVEIPGTTYRTVAGPDGAYRLTGLPAGRYAVRLRHADVDLLGIDIEPTEVDLEAGQAVRVVLGFPSGARVLRRVCPASRAAGGGGKLVYGVVRDAAGAVGVPNAGVQLVAGGRDVRVTANGRGVYRACVETRPDVAWLAATPPGRPSDAAEPVQVELHGRDVARADVRIAPAAASAIAPTRAWRGEEWSNAVVGVVLEEGTKEPVPTAAVALADTSGATVASTLTDARGRFRLLHPGVGNRYTVRVEHTGFQRAESPITFRPAEELHVEIVLGVRAVELEPIVITERRRGYLADVGFYDRARSRSGGLFIDQEEIDRTRPSQLTDLLRGRPGVEVVRAGLNEDVRVITAARLGGGDCQPALWLDGSLVRAGGEPKTAGAGGGAVQVDPNLSEVVSPNVVSAIELYARPADVPARYGGSAAACGVILIWTRRGR